MKLKALLCCALLCVASALLHAEIFKTVDKDGNVTFSDKASQGSSTVELNHSNTVPAVETTVKLSPEEANAATDENGDSEANKISYQSVYIIAPANDSAIEHGPGNFTVAVRVLPALLQGHKVRVLVDGKPAGPPVPGYSVPMTNVDRGTHSLVAQVIDASGQVLKSSPGSIVHVFRPSVAFPGYSR